jgi:cell wall-associated NlpC family hydrolase
MTRGELVAAEAREWIGTPFHDQASVKGVGCDCKGLVWGVARELGFPEADSFHARFVHYDLHRKGGVPTGLLKEGMAALLLNHGGKVQHMAIALDNGRAVHAQVSPKAWVKEASLRALLRLCPLDSAWRWRPECR